MCLIGMGYVLKKDGMHTLWSSHVCEKKAKGLKVSLCVLSVHDGKEKKKNLRSFKSVHASL